MTKRSTPPQAASDPHAREDDQAHIEAELDELESIVRAAHDADLRSATSTLISSRSH